MSILRLTLPILLVASAAAARPGAGSRGYRREIPGKLAAETKISEDAARDAALRKVPNGVVSSIELERAGGQLLYSVDIRVPGRRGVEEVHVSPLDGRVRSREHESSKREREEEAAEKAGGAAPGR
jgi:Peptidase propeptide and YPEB domain